MQSPCLQFHMNRPPWRAAFVESPYDASRVAVYNQAGCAVDLLCVAPHGRVIDATWSPDSQYVVVRTDTNTACLFYVAPTLTGRRTTCSVMQLSVPDMGSLAAPSVAWAPDGTAVALLTNEAELHVYSLSTLVRRCLLYIHHANDMSGLFLSNKGNLVRVTYHARQQRFYFVSAEVAPALTADDAAAPAPVAAPLAADASPEE